MRKIILLSIFLSSVTILPAQGVYQLWGMTPRGGANNSGVIFSTDAAGNNFHLRHQFTYFNGPGAYPQNAQPVEYNGKLYGATTSGGRFGGGVIFEWDPATNIYTKKIDINVDDGFGPEGSLTLSNGKFYGMTLRDIFEWDPVTNVYTNNYHFDDINGSFPRGSLTLDGDIFYGMTSDGGSNHGGVIFEWDPATNVYTKKYEFDGTGFNGGNPRGSLTLSGGKFYGMAGVIFEWDPVTNIYTKKMDFDGTNGGQPYGDFTLNDSKLYGMTELGGSNGLGVIFEWDPSSNLITKKIDFDGTNGASPLGNLTLSGGKFYGLTTRGGSDNAGTIFEWDPVTDVYTKKIDFRSPDGSNPQGSITLSNGKFYGMTHLGGTYNSGTFFEWDPTSNIHTKRVDFVNRIIDGVSPAGSLVQSNGRLYCMAGGGKNQNGVIFEFDPSADVYTKKIDLIDSTGAGSRGSLTLNGGKFYGMADGGKNGYGVIFQWDPITNIYTKKIDFDGSNGIAGSGNLVPDGNKFYGMSTSGGTSDKGVIFEWDPTTNVSTKKIDFNGIDGANPTGSLTMSDGKFYGMTPQGGKYTTVSGVIFEWDPITNAYTKKIDLDAGTGYSPYGSLTLRDGKLYGMTFFSGGPDKGGTVQGGAIFEWDPATNVYSKKIDYDGGHAHPFGSLTLSGDKFYGMTPEGGSIDAGVIFEWDPTTNVYTVKKNFNGPDGFSPDFGNDLTRAAAPVANGLPGSCISFTSVTIDSSNNNKWVSITDSMGNAVAEIKANGNNLGIVNTSMYINNAAVREDGNKRLYLDRNLTLTPTVQPASPVDIRLYINGSEFLALKNALNSNGDSSGIRSINDIAIYIIENDCSPAVSTVLSNPLTTTTEGWQTDYVLTASISSFSSFYFANKTLACPGPVIQCKADTVVNSSDHHCGTVVRFNPPVVTDACGTSIVKQIAGLHSGAFFPVGNTINTFVATSSLGKTDTCSFTVTVKDTKPPFITPVWAFPSVLWPPNHKMKKVSVNYYAFDNCGPASCSLDVSSDEPVTGTGYGDKAPDWVIVDNHHVLLRAERAGHGNGRTYTITVTCTDASGNISKQKTRVLVPHQSHRHYSKGEYSFGEENDGYIDSNGDYFDDLLVCKVLPNPSSQYFNLEIESSSNEKIEVNLYDINGRFISKLNAVKNQTYKFGDNLRPGMYMVEVRQGQQRKTVKVVKQ